MCLYMSVPQWLNLQNFLKAINECINHTIDVSFMFIYLKCLNNRSNNNKQNAAIKTAKSATKQIVSATQTNQDENYTIDFNVNLKKINSFEMFPFHKTYSEIGQVERKLTMKYHNQNLQQHHNHYYLPQQQQQQQPQRHYCLCNNDQLLLMDKFKTIPLHI